VVDRDVVAVARALAGAVGLSAGGLWLFLAYVVLGSRFASSLATDPHGYGLIFGTVLAVPVGLVSAVTLPFLFPRHRRGLAFAVSAATCGVGTAVLVTALLTA
jgi:hypothetical protein